MSIGARCPETRGGAGENGKSNKLETFQSLLLLRNFKGRIEGLVRKTWSRRIVMRENLIEIFSLAGLWETVGGSGRIRVRDTTAVESQTESRAKLRRERP